MGVTGKRVAVLVEQQYQEMEVWYPVYRLREAGCVVRLVGPAAGKTYASKLGYPVTSDTAAAAVTAADFDALVIPGGFAPDYIRRNEAMLKLVRDIAAAGKPTAAICHGPWVLCSTTAMKGRKVTCYQSIKDDVVNAGGEYIDVAMDKAVVDGNFVTAPAWPAHPDWLAKFLVVLGTKITHS